MGQVTSELRKSDSVNNDIKEQLDFLVKIADLKLDKFQSEIERGFTDPEYTAKRQVPGKRALRWVRGYRVGVTQEKGTVVAIPSGVDPDVSSVPAAPVTSALDDSIQGILSSFLGIHNPDPQQLIALGTLKKNVLAGIAFILESETVGVLEDKRFFVFMLNNAVIRIDACIWKYNFSSKKVFASAQDVLCYTLCLSVVDHTVLNVDEMVFLVSEYTGTPQQTVDYSHTLSSLWYQVNRMAISLPSDEKNKADALGQGYNPVFGPVAPLSPVVYR